MPKSQVKPTLHLERAICTVWLLPTKSSGKRVTTKEVHSALESKGYRVSLRSVQRLLMTLMCAYVAEFDEYGSTRLWFREDSLH